MRHTKRILLSLGAVALIVPPVLATDNYGQVELLRDAWGTPHVLADSDLGAIYGLGYAAAEDRAFQMTYTLRIMQGRLAEVIGDVKKTRRDETALDNDRKMRTFGFYRAAQRLADHLDADSAAVLAAYSDGVNAYFNENAENLHPLFARVGLEPETWTVGDCLVSWWHVAQFFATDGTRDLMRYRNIVEGDPRRRGMAPPADLETVPRDGSTAVVGRDDVSDEWVARTRAFLRKHGHAVDDSRVSSAQGTPPGPKFSHAWVAGGKMTGTGAAVLVSKPQTPVTNPSLFYEFHIEGKTFNARGVGVAGSPIILIGWNENVAWGMTALGADQADLFRLKTDSEHPHQYLFDGRWRPIELIHEEIKVKGGRRERLTIRQTHFGPVVNRFAFARPGDPPVALKRVPICETDRDTIDGALAMMRSADVSQFAAALEDWRFPTANVVFGDASGAIGYSAVGALPLRSPHALDGGGAAHDGSDSQFDWQAIVPQDLVPHVINPSEGYLFSGNHRPVGPFYEIPLGISTGAMGDTLRSWRLRELFADRTSISPEELREMMSDAVNPARRDIARIGYHLRDALERDLSPDATRALEHLEDWYAAGAPSRSDVPGAELAMNINTFFRMMATDLAYVYGGGESGLAHFLKTVGKRLDEDPRADISSLEQEYIDDSLAAAWNASNARGASGRGTTRPRAAASQRRLGYLEGLDGFPSVDPDLDVDGPPLVCTDGGTIFSQAAESYNQWVPLHDVDSAQSILPIGSSEDPRRASRTINLSDWSAGRMHPAPITRAAVRRIAESEKTLIP